MKLFLTMFMINLIVAGFVAYNDIKTGEWKRSDYITIPLFVALFMTGIMYVIFHALGMTI